MAIPVVIPFAAKRVVKIPSWQRGIVHEHRDDVEQLGIEAPAVSTQFQRL